MYIHLYISISICKCRGCVSGCVPGGRRRLRRPQWRYISIYIYLYLSIYLYLYIYIYIPGGRRRLRLPRWPSLASLAGRRRSGRGWTRTCCGPPRGRCPSAWCPARLSQRARAAARGCWAPIHAKGRGGVLDRLHLSIYT